MFEDDTPLRAWCESSGTSILQVAKAVRVSYGAVWEWHQGTCLPDLINAFRLEQVTSGGVPAASWLGTNLGKRRWETLADLERFDDRKKRSLKAHRERQRARRIAAKEKEV